ncbi:MAG: SUMF1/EgtB/PvdO family nonheme iron enzyme [Nannocystis sp.]|nr:SUMF1/EgtB/PvdO family nonheme iron enzyme [Nannocystis sp.]
MRTAATSLVFALAASACGRDRLDTGLAPLATPSQARCGVIKSRDRPVIIEWPSADRANLEQQIRRGDKIVVVRYEGCEMEVLRDCAAPGAYRYAAVQRKEESSSLKDEDELYAKIPLGAAQLVGELKSHGALELTMTIVGGYESSSASLPRHQLTGACEGATHLVRSLTVGAFTLSSGRGAEARVGAEAWGAGAGGRTARERGALRSDGDPRSCHSGDDDAPPDQCGALLRLEVVPLGEAAAPRRRARPCPPDTVEFPGGQFVDSGDGWGAGGEVAPLCVAQHEVTVAEYRGCVGDSICSEAPSTVSWPSITDAERSRESERCNATHRGRRDHPVNCVAWNQADAYCRAQGGRLPTEAEWEWIARGGDQSRTYPWGEDHPDARLLNACGKECDKASGLYPRSDGHRSTAPVDSFKKGRGRWRIADLAGNVWEWTASGDDSERVIRGGGFDSKDDAQTRSSSRATQAPRDRRADLGFRCVWTPSAP